MNQSSESTVFPPSRASGATDVPFHRATTEAPDGPGLRRPHELAPPAGPGAGRAGAAAAQLARVQARTRL